MINLINSAHANEAAVNNPISGFIPLILIFAIFYFFIIRPQQKKIKDHQVMVDGLKKGDVVLTSGGVYGIINKVKEEILDVEIAKNVIVKIAKSTVSNKSDNKIKFSSEEKSKKVVKKKKDA